MTRPDEGDISVVVQGPVVRSAGRATRTGLTDAALQSVRRQLPRAELVLSTWSGADVSGLTFDRLVESADPGTARCDSEGPAEYYNVNRQIVSTYEGLRAATRTYAVKLRSDMVLTGTGFLDLFTRFPSRSSNWRLFRERVVVPTYYSRNPHLRFAYPFHPSDWFQFGVREDLLDLWNIPLAPRDMIRWFDTHSRPEGDRERWASYRFTAEQWVWLSFLRKHGDVTLAHKLDASAGSIALSETVLANNLVIASLDAIGIRFLKYPHSLVHWSTLYTHGEWQRLYQKYCAPDFRPAPDLAAMLRAAYVGAVRPLHEALLSPRTSRLGRFSERWRSRAPSSFERAKRLYESAWMFMGRIARR
ncbi:MAG: WavE lipopolysaccharide synthesis [Gemmatimonadetes bacterium]|nr:WavE lipopolysaccharide synthesis [Gemmatimonadota bacterium]